MSLTAADVAEIMRLVESSSFDELSLELNGMKLHLRRGGAPVDGASGEGTQVAYATANSTPATGTPANGTPSQRPGAAPPIHATRRSGGKPTPPSAAPAPQPAANLPTTDPALHEVTAPLLGTFYRAPKPGAPPFVERGSAVEPDTVIAIIEVMKLMNSVRAGVQGTVVDILPADGALVEYGETILRVAKSG